MPQIPWLDSFYSGRGVNSATGKTYGVALESDPATSETTGQRVALQLVLISSSHELTERLNIAASASVKLGIGGLSAEFNLANSAEINSYYTYALIRCTVMNAPKIIRNPVGVQVGARCS